MALSDNERKLLAEMEAALEQEDPRLLSTLTGKARTRQGSRALLGLSILVVGLLVLISGLIAKATVVGVIAFFNLLNWADINYYQYQGQLYPGAGKEARLGE